MKDSRCEFVFNRNGLGGSISAALGGFGWGGGAAVFGYGHDVLFDERGVLVGGLHQGFGGGSGEGEDFYADASGSKEVNELREVAIAGDEGDDVNFVAEGEGVECDAHIPVALGRAVGPYAKGFAFHLEAGGLQDGEEGGLVAGVVLDDVSDGADELTAFDDGVDELGEFESAAEDISCGIVHVLNVNKDADALSFDDFHDATSKGKSGGAKV